MTLNDFWQKYKGSGGNVSVSDFWKRYKEQKATPTVAPATVNLSVAPSVISSMFGSYTNAVDPTKYGGYTPSYWQAALGERIKQEGLGDKQYMIDWGDQGLQYKAEEGQRPYAYSSESDPEPYKQNIEGLGNTPLGVWVYTGTGDPTKTTEKGLTRNDPREATLYKDWKFIPAIDAKTINVGAIPEEYRQQREGAFIQREDLRTNEDGSPYYDTTEKYLDPTKIQPGMYSTGREKGSLLQYSGYVPAPTEYHYDSGGVEGFLKRVGGGIENFASRNSAAIAAGLFTLGTAGMGAAMGAAGTGALGVAGTSAAPGALSAGTTSAIGGALGGGLSNAAVTGQKTNDPLRIFTGGAAGAIGGAIPGVNAALGSGTSLATQVGLNAALGSAAGAGQGYAATGNPTAALRGGLYGGAAAGLGTLAAPVTSATAKALIDKGVSPTIANAIASGSTKALTGSAMAGVTGRDVGEAGLLGAASGSAGSLGGSYFGKAWSPFTSKLATLAVK